MVGSDSHYAVAVVGAGPAGASCANMLCLGGVSNVALIDRSRFPRDKACGDGITGNAIDVMRELGVDDVLAHYPAITRLVMTAPSGALAAIGAGDTKLPLPRAHVIPRLEFDNHLTCAALDRGAADLTGFRLEGAVRCDGRWRLDLAGAAPDHETRRITADFLIGADGAMSRVRRILGLRLNSDSHTGIAIRAYGTMAAPQEPLLRLDIIDLIWPGYAWLFSCGSRRVNIGFGTHLSRYRGQSHHLRDALVEYASGLSGGFTIDPKTFRSAPLPHAGQLPRLAVPEHRAALIGDAASMINTLTGEGISYGMMAGLMLGRELSEAIRRGHDLGTAAARYERAFRKEFGAHFRGNFVFSKIMNMRPMVNRIIASYGRDPDYFREAVAFMLGGERSISLPRVLLLGLRT